MEFFVVYVQEAHPSDGWQMPINVEEDVIYRQHQSYIEREETAAACSLGLDIRLPILIEEMDNAIDYGYGAAPERLYLIDADGFVAYRGGGGPHFFNVAEWEQAIEACLAKTSVLG